MENGTTKTISLEDLEELVGSLREAADIINSACETVECDVVLEITLKPVTVLL